MMINCGYFIAAITQISTFTAPQYNILDDLMNTNRISIANILKNNFENQKYIANDFLNKN